MLLLIFIINYYPDAVENQKDYSYNSSNKLPSNYNPLMLPFKNDFLCVYYWGLLTHFSLLDSSILKWNIENHEVVNSENYLPFYMPK